MANKIQKPYDITKSGPQDFRTIRKQLASIDAPTDKEYLYKKNMNNSYLGRSMYNAAEAAPTVVQSPLYNTNTKLGQSYFDKDVYTKGEFEDASSIRGENQPAIIQALNGTAKGTILAGTTAMSGILGIPYGIFSAVNNKDFSKLWDNDITRTAQLINDASEEWLPNYYTKEQLESSWYSPTNLFSANFLFDKVIKNIGFTVGAAYSGGIYTKAINAVAKGIGALKAMARTGKTFEEAAKLGARAMQMNAKTRFMKSAVGSTFSAVAEGSVEALNNSKDYVDIYRQKVDAHTAEGMNNAYREFAIAGGQFDGEGNPILDNTPRSVMLQNELTRLQNAKKQAYEEIENTRASMGNADLIANLPILTLGNWLTFGKMYAGGYKAARNTSRVTTRATKEARAAAEAEGKEAVKRLNRVVEKAKKTGYQGLTQEEKALVEEGTDHLLGDKTYAALMAVREPLKEGNEEMAQAAAAKSSQNYYGSRVDAIYDAAMDNYSRSQVLDWWKASVQGFKDIYGDFNNYEEGFIGALTGLMGSPTFGKKNNSTSETYLGRSKWIGMSGGVVPQWRNAIKGREQEAEIVSHVNSILKNGNLERDMKHLIAQTFFDEKQRVAAIKNDKLEYKDSELASIFENIMYLKEAGKIDLLHRAIENMDGFTEEDAKAILEMTKKDINIDGQNVTSLNKRKDDLISESEKLTKQNEEAQKSLNDFISSLTKNTNTFTFDANGNITYGEENDRKIKEAQESINRTKETIDNIEKTIEDIDVELSNKKSTTVSPYLNEDGELKTTQEVLEDLNKRKSKYKKIIGEITGNMDSIDAATEETLTNDQLKTLTWYKVMMKDWQERANSMATSMSRFIRDFLNDNVSKEQLAKLDEELGGLDIKHLTAEEMQSYGGALVNRHILRNILGGSQSIVKLLEDIANEYSKEDLGLSLARLLDSDKEVEIGEEKNKTKVKLGDYLFDFIKANLMANDGITQDVKNNFFTLLSDLKKIGKNYNSYNKLLTEYTKNPSKIDAAHQETLNNAERESNKNRSKNLKDNLSFGGHRGNLAKDLKNNADEIETIGLDKFKDSLNENELKEFTEAESLIDGLDSLNHIIETSDLEDEVKKALQSKAVEALDEVDSVNEFLDKFKSLDPNEALEDALETSNLDDLEKLDKLEDLAAQYKEFMDNNLSKVADAIEAKRKAQIDDIEEKAKRAADALDKKEKIAPPKEKKLREPKEKKGTTLADRQKNKRKEDNKRAEQPKERPNIDETKEAVKKQGTNSDISNRKARRKKNGYSSENANRPQLSEVFFYGRDLLTYVEYITKNPDRVPKFVVSKLFPNIKTQQDFIKAYTKYIKVTYQYLKDSGAFEYIKYNLKANDKLIFTVDEALNKEAGVPVVIIKAMDKDGNYHAVGTMKTELDFMSINSRNNTTYGTTEAAQKKLYDEIVYKFKASKSKTSISSSTRTYKYTDISGNETSIQVEKEPIAITDLEIGDRFFGPNNTIVTLKEKLPNNEYLVEDNGNTLIASTKTGGNWNEWLRANPKVDRVYQKISSQQDNQNREFVGAESSVKKLMGGDVAFSNTESSISSIFNNTGTEVIFGIVNGNGIVSTTNADIDSKILQVDIAKAKEGQVYVLIPSNNGSLLPALCYGDVIEDLLEKPNDWYIEETIKAIQKLTNITQIGENKNKVAKWLGISTQTINMSVGHLNADNKFIEDDDIVNADRVRVAYNDSKGKRQYMYIALSDDKTISHENAKKFIASFASRFSTDNPLTVNLDTQRLRDKEYISNMSKYYYTNIVQGQTHSVNDWFLYNKTKTEIDNEERKKAPKPPTRTPSETTPTGKPKDSKETTVEGKEYTVNKDGRVYNEKGELVVGEERTKVLDNENKPSEDITESKESTEKKETKEKPKESIDLASQLLGGARRRRRVQEKEEKKEDDKKDDDDKPDKSNYSQDQVNTTRARQGNNRRRPNRTTASSEPSETSKPSESIAPKQKIISKAISLFPNIDKGRIESIVNKIFESVENTYPLIDSIKKAIQFFKNKIGTLNIEAYNNFIDTILSPSEKETLEREGENEFKSSQPVDFNLRVLQRTESILNSIREYINGDITVKSKKLLKVFETIKNIIDSLGKNIIILNNFFNNVIAQTTAIITDVAEVNTENLRLKYAYSNLNSNIQQWMNERGTNIEAYERLSPKQQEDYIRCMI
jgi:hypothetical protein